MLVSMSSQTHRPERSLEPVPSDLDSAQAKLVYVSLEAAGSATADDLEAMLSMKKLSILSILNTLSNAGYVDQRGEEYVVSN